MTSLPGRVRAELSGLTTRGRSFVSAGLASGVCALLLGQKDLLRIAVLLIVLPLGCVALLARARYRVGLSRAVTPERAVAGTPVRVRLELQNLARAGAQVLLAEDQTPPALGPPTRFVLARLTSGRRITVTYSLGAAVRGRYSVGPLRLRVGDPFGMCETSRAFTGLSPLTVVPQQWPLRSGGGGGTWGGTGDSVTRAAAVHGEDDVATREYRDGDELRRIHWRSTAKRGQLMVRREEQPRQLRATVLLDSRQSGHRGQHWASSYEWSVTMAASVAAHLVTQNYGVRLLTDAAPATWSRPQAPEEVTQLQDRLAVTQLRPDPPAAPGRQRRDSLDDALRVLLSAGGDGLVVAVLGEVDAGHVEALTRLGRRGVPCVAVLLRVAEWAGSDGTAGPVADRDAGPSTGPSTGPDAPPSRARPDTRLRPDEARGRLEDAGWLVAEAGPESVGTQVWAEATRGGTAWGGRSALSRAGRA